MTGSCDEDSWGCWGAVRDGASVICLTLDWNGVSWIAFLLSGMSTLARKRE